LLSLIVVQTIFHFLFVITQSKVLFFCFFCKFCCFCFGYYQNTANFVIWFWESNFAIYLWLFFIMFESFFVNHQTFLTEGIFWKEFLFFCLGEQAPSFLGRSWKKAQTKGQKLLSKEGAFALSFRAFGSFLKKKKPHKSPNERAKTLS